MLLHILPLIVHRFLKIEYRIIAVYVKYPDKSKKKGERWRQRLVGCGTLGGIAELRKVIGEIAIGIAGVLIGIAEFPG